MQVSIDVHLIIKGDDTADAIRRLTERLNKWFCEDVDHPRDQPLDNGSLLYWRATETARLKPIDERLKVNNPVDPAGFRLVRDDGTSGETQPTEDEVMDNVNQTCIES